MPNVKLTLAEARAAVEKMLIGVEAWDGKESSRHILLKERIINKILTTFPEVIEIPSAIEEDLENIRPLIENVRKLAGGG